MLRAIPVEGLDVDKNCSLDDGMRVRRAEGFDEGRRLGVALMDLNAAKDFEAGLVGIVHEEEGYTSVMLKITQTDILLVAAKVREADQPRIDDANETLWTTPVLHVGPAGLADRGHVEAVAALDEVLLGRT